MYCCQRDCLFFVAAFYLDEVSAQTEAESENLLNERQDYVENDFEEESREVEFESENCDLSNTAQEYQDREITEESFEKKTFLDNSFDISDSECNINAESKITFENLVTVEDEPKIAENKLVDEVQEISDDEFVDVALLDEPFNETEKEMAIAEFPEEAPEHKISEQELIETINEISDDEMETREITVSDQFIEEPPRNGDGFIEEVPVNGDIFMAVPTRNGDELLENNNEFTGETTKYNKETIAETPENFEEFAKYTPEIEGELIAESHALIEDNQEYGYDESMDEEIPEQNGLAEVNSEYSEATKPQEYLEVPIKKEIYDVLIKEEVDDVYDTENYNFEESFPQEIINNDELPPEDIYHVNNKIILGSKPSPRIQGNIDCRKNKLLVVLLDDWSVHLNQSQSFCTDCNILFTTPNALDAHKMTAHSLLAPITNRAIKSTAKSSVIGKSSNEVKNIARKSTGYSKNQDISNSTYCNHCNVTFKDHTALIKHLYELLPVKQYSCNICDESFQKQHDLLNHNSVHVKIEPRKIMKAKKKLDENPLLRSLLTKEVKQINSKSVKQIHPKAVKRSYPIDSKIDLSLISYRSKYASRYKCMICNNILDTYSEARKHRLTHSEVLTSEKRAMVLKRLIEKYVKPNNSKYKHEEDSNYKKVKHADKNVDYFESGTNGDNPFELIPKSALFQCSKCSLHFSSCFAGTAHMARNKCSANGQYSCPTCKKKLRKKDKLCHIKQHELCTKLIIYKITKNINERTLCRCLKCGVHFDFLSLKMHIKKCGKIPAAKCQRCNIMLPKHKLANHANKHDLRKLKPKDFILVDYAAVNDTTKSKPATVATKKANNRNAHKKIVKLNTKENLQGKKIVVKPEITVKKGSGSVQKQSNIIRRLTFEKEKVKLYFCKHCKSFLSRRNLPRSNQTHLSKKCSGVYKYTCYNCELCGLRIPQKSRQKHGRLHAENNVTIKDFEFYEFATLKPIDLPIPKYPRCDKCRIHFLSPSRKKQHICGEDFDNCEFCGQKFEITALEVHRPLHRLNSAGKRKLTQRETSNQAKIMPELMKKYESLNAIWNILFICGQCELVTDLYNKAVEHSQAHLKKDHTQKNTIKCYICDLKFDESCWSKHSELHSRMNINKKDFKMLKYVPYHLLDETWFKMFENLPEKEIRQIIDRSVFGSERSLKMRLVKDGLPEFTVYCCSNCQVSFDNNNILDHIKSKCESSTHVCKKCDISFDGANTLKFHDLLHKKGIKKEEFRIVHFVKISNDTNNSLKDKKIMKTKQKKDIVLNTKVLKRRKKVTEKGPQFVLYKCEECTVCVHLQMNQTYHICAPEHHLIFCKICKQNFSFRQIGAHRVKHKRQGDFRARNTKIISFSPIPEGKDKPRRKNYRKTTSKQRNYKKEPASPKIKPTRSTYNVASAKSSENNLESLHSSDIDQTSSSAKRSPSVDSFESLVNLITSDKHTKSKERKTLNSSKHNLNLRTVSTESNDNDLQTDGKRTAKLYKCDCGLHFTSLRTIEKHIETCNSDNNVSKENCSKCGLLFPTDILVSHLCKHHSQDTNSKTITVEEVHNKSKIEATSTQGGHKTLPVKDCVKLYKCSECNVYFLNQNTCYKHTIKHEALDPRQYIECKMCCLQFRIQSLSFHMKKHHETEFNLEKVLVEEYAPSVEKQAPKINIYYASEGFQNVQVSSSND